MSGASTYESFLNSPYYCLKHTNYFQVYDELLLKFVGLPITFLEIGILDGGSLFMWRDFLGDKARIIGVDLNPEAIKWREHGFEIFIGDQSNPDFWKDLYDEIGDIDILLDDGGHRNDQQMVTVQCSLEKIRDGGIIIVEDTQTSFMKFENFKSYSFVNLLLGKTKLLYARSSDLNIKETTYSKCVHSIQFFESICALHIDRRKCRTNERTENDGIKDFSQDFRYENDGFVQTIFRRLYDYISIDYLSRDRELSHPFLTRIMKNKYLRLTLRCVIIPARGSVYCCIKLMNLLNLKSLLRQIESRHIFKK
jgi:hypothetical protein